MLGLIAILAATPGHAWRDPEWLQAVAALMPALAGAVGALVAILPQRRVNRRLEDKVDRAGRAAEDAHYAITNDHSSPLREDLDEQFAAVLEDLRQTRLAVASIAEAQRASDITIGEAIFGLKTGIERLAERSKEEESAIRKEGTRIAAEIESRLEVIESRPCSSCDAGAAVTMGEEP